MNNLAELIRRGGVYYRIPGKNLREVLEALVRGLVLPPSIRREELLEAVLERECLMTTGIGGGIALPHPRNPLAAVPAEELTALAFLETPVDWKALDGRMVDTVILIVSSTAKLHLHTLSRINFLCRQKEFLRLLEKRASQEEIAAAVEQMEQAWMEIGG
ncbi:MAG: PTS sugar transporter subunit IIA [Treponema sp.]|jgi:PTS system nitrogen regulatory IIA component|nr:PTS sugar transporter subunit IIA [Treponema sp.]